MIPYDRARIKQVMDESQSSNSTYDKGKKFEDLACYLFEINSKNINKSLKYKQLEQIVFSELAKIELQLQKEMQ